MKLYNETIKETLDYLEGFSSKALDYMSRNWDSAGDHNLVLKCDMAYELGGGTHDAVSGVAITSDSDFVSKDEVLLIGPDLSEINEDTSYARIAIVRASDDSLGDGNKLYNAIRKIEYVRYHVTPEGYMTRISASNGREPVRVSRDAIERGISFSDIGNHFISQYHENPNVEAVKLIFITDPSVDYNFLKKLSTKCESITGTIDHIMKNVIMDCNACSLKPVCDEVEGLKELHFANKL